MRKKLLWIAPAIIAIAFLCTAFGGGDDSKHSSGSPGGYTGSPGDGHNCNACHGGSTATVTGWITSDVPAAGYTPGTTYTITATATGTGKKGFEISPQTLTGALVGTVTPGSGNKLCNGNKAITHSSTITASPATWTFTWTAPAAGTGAVTFYGAFAITEAATKLTTMVVSENAAIPLSATATATPSTINSGETSQLNVTVAGGTGTYSFSWVSNPAGFTSTLQNPVVSPTVTTTYTVTVTSGSASVSSPVAVTVNAVLPLSATATANPTTINAGQTSQLNVVVSGGTGTYSYSWVSNPAGFTSTLQNPVVSPTVTTTYTVTVTSGTASVSSPVTVTVNPVLPLTATASANPMTINAGQTSQLNVVASGGIGNYTYSWVSSPIGFTSTLQNPVVSPILTTIYTVTVTSGSANANSSVTVTVNTANPLSATATAAPSTICNGQSTQLGVTVSGGTPPYIYSWTSVPAGFTSTLQSPSASPVVTTIYTVQVSDGLNSANSSVTVTVNQEPIVNAGIDTTVCKDDLHVPLHGTASNSSSVAWTTSGDGTFSTTTALNSIYNPGTGDHTTGFVDLTLTASPIAPCVTPVTSVRHIVFDPCTGIPFITGDQAGIVLSPNPSTGMITIDLGRSGAINAGVTVYDSQGKEVMQQNINGSKATLDMLAFPKGLYIVKIQTNNGSKTEKLILQ